MPYVIEAAHYGETERKLQADPLIRRMAAEALDDGYTVETFDFSGRMLDCLRYYTAECERIGRKPIGSHIGGPINAIRALMDRPQTEQPTMHFGESITDIRETVKMLEFLGEREPENQASILDTIATLEGFVGHTCSRRAAARRKREAS